MKSITHLFFDLRLRKSSVLKCRTIVSINTFTKQNNRRRKEKTRHLAMMNSRREEPRVLFITFYLINRKKKPSIENITRVKVYISSFMQARFICIHAGLYLYPCYFILTSIVKKKWLIFYGSNSCYNDSKIKMKEKKGNEKNTSVWHDSIPRDFPMYPRTLPQNYESFVKWCENFLFKQNWRHHHRKHIQSV